MKKIYTTLVACMSFFASNAQMTQGDLTLNQNFMFQHDSASCYSYGAMFYDLTISNSFMNDTVWIIDTWNGSLIDSAVNHTGQNPWYVSFNFGAGYGGYGSFDYFQYDVNLNNTPGTVVMYGSVTKIINNHSNTSADTMYNIYNDIFGYVNNPCLFGNVTGKAYIDNNSNCVFDGSDVALNTLQVSGTSNLVNPSSNLSASNSAYTDNNGNYNLQLQQTYMSNYSVSLPNNYSFIFPSTSCSPTMYLDSILPQINFDFSLQCSSNIDVSCYASSMGVVRPNIPFYMHPYVSNTGCVAASGTLKFVLDNRVNYDANQSSNPATTVSGDTLIWNYTNLNNLSSGGYWNSFISGIHLTPNLSVNIGDTLCFRVLATIQSGDVDITNNDYTICLPVVNSYDPNIKEVYPKGDSVNGQIPVSTSKLFYVVHFQNTGNAVAYNVNIVDTLDSDINPASLQILGSSHTVSPEWIAPGVVKFNFNNINLADSISNEPASHGSVRYSVELMDGLTVGTQIKNTAHIYFDFNTAIVTNTTVNTLVDPKPLGIEAQNIEMQEVKVYPNPFADRTTFVLPFTDKIVSFEMTDVLGKNVRSIQGITSKEFTVERGSLSEGVYFYKIKSGHSVINVGKLVVR
jgi:uncharacterized repeat protein (TIGR01451 family)